MTKENCELAILKCPPLPGLRGPDLGAVCLLIVNKILTMFGLETRQCVYSNVHSCTAMLTSIYSHCACDFRIGGFQMPNKCPTSGGQANGQEATPCEKHFFLSFSTLALRK